jgi:hypothetical protein
MPGRKSTVTREPAAHVTAAVLGIAQGGKKEGNADDSDKACGPHGGHLICGDYTAETAGVVSTRIEVNLTSVLAKFDCSFDRVIVGIHDGQFRPALCDRESPPCLPRSIPVAGPSNSSRSPTGGLRMNRDERKLPKNHPCGSVHWTILASMLIEISPSDSGCQVARDRSCIWTDRSRTCGAGARISP